MKQRCIAVLGGSFDPVHNGHIALAYRFSELIAADTLRVIPTGNPWQKEGLNATSDQRLAMLRLALSECPIPLIIDMQEIERTAQFHSATYTIDTLRTLREEYGPETSIAFLIGADQLQGFTTWKEWQQLFNYANFCVASRPGIHRDESRLPASLAAEIAQRSVSPSQIASLSHGAICIDDGFDVDISATQIRNAIQHREPLNTWLPASVLDYITQHHLYQK